MGLPRRDKAEPDTYGVEVEELGDVVLVLAVTVAVDALAHDRG
ncbi:MAG: hypothetical protein ABWZ52_04015 [Acidimicrobiales bacterium]